MVEAVFWLLVFAFTLMLCWPDDRSVNCVFLADAACPLCDLGLSVFHSVGKVTLEMNGALLDSSRPCQCCFYTTRVSQDILHSKIH